jgi:hypothetical protein
MRGKEKEKRVGVCKRKGIERGLGRAWQSKRHPSDEGERRSILEMGKRNGERGKD